MLWQRERARLEHENAMRQGAIAIEQVTGENRPETAAADDYEIEHPAIWAVEAIDGFFQGIAAVAAQNVEGEERVLGICDCRHKGSFRW